MRTASKVRMLGRFLFRELTPDGKLVKQWEAANLVVTTGLAWLSGALTGDVADPTIMKYIGVGTDSTAAATTDTALGVEVETRATATPTQQTTDYTNDTFQLIGTITMGSSRNITEVGIFSQAALGGTMLSRSVFSAETVGAGNSLQVTYKCDFDAA